MSDQLVVLPIERMSYGPHAIAHLENGKTVFVAGAVIGDVVEAHIDTETDRMAQAHVVRILEPSALRATDPTSQFAASDATPWAALSYSAQLEAKRSSVVDALVRIGHLDPSWVEVLVDPCMAPGDPWGYRNKIELSCTRNQSGKLEIGMAASDGTLINMRTYPLFEKRYQRIVPQITGALSYLSGTRDLDLERIGIRASKRTQEIEIGLWTKPGPFPRGHVAKVLSDALGTYKPTSIVRILQKGSIKSRRIVGVERLSGKGYWSETIRDERMALSAPSFFQVNTRGAEALVRLVLEGLAPQTSDTAMDLYCGAGTFTLPLARTTGFVSAVEAYGPAVRDLRRNLELTKTNNVDAVGGDAGREFPQTHADIIVVDPPRAGLAHDVVKQLSEQTARSIAYVSCDPATLARDIARFRAQGRYEVSRITPVDLFPQTYHVECVCLMERVK